MSIIAIQTIRSYWLRHDEANQPLLSWIEEVDDAKWETPNQLQGHYRNASILNGRRTVFNIMGNKYRLIVDIEYRLGIVFIVWLGTHKEYDKIDAKTIRYVKGNKK